jgi:hypothetical protein
VFEIKVVGKNEIYFVPGMIFPCFTVFKRIKLNRRDQMHKNHDAKHM